MELSVWFPTGSVIVKAWEKADEAARKFKHDQIVNTLKSAGKEFFPLLKRARALKLKGLSSKQRRIWFESLNVLENSPDLFNALNEATPLSRQPTLSSRTADYLLDVVSPRVWKLGVRVAWR